MADKPDHAPSSNVQKAFGRIVSKAKWGVFGAVLGAGLLAAFAHVSLEAHAAYMSVVGIMTGAFAGAALAGGGFGAIGWSMAACMFFGFCLSPCFMQPFGGSKEVMLLLLGLLFVGFLLGTIIDFTNAWAGDRSPCPPPPTS